jgi:hypothetical protein
MDADLHDFIADCEFKTRRILRDSNKRLKDSARLAAAKERVELLKQKGGSRAVVKSQSDPKTPNKSSSSKEIKSHLSHDTGAYKEWKGRDKIIHDACETIKSLDEASKVRTESNAESKLPASLYASPFNDKGSMVPTSAKKVASGKKSRGRREKTEPAVITRRTIERDFYIMSKKGSKPKPKRRQRSTNNGEAKPELTSSVLWKKYRCIDQVMEAKSREAKKLYVKFEHLKPFNDDSTNEADDESSSSSEEENHRHALQDLLDAHVDEENLRSQRRVDKMLSEVTFKPDVQAMWDQLEQGLGNKVAQRNSLVNGKNYSQVQSVPLSAATKKFIRPSKIKDVPMQTSVVYHETSKQSVARYVSPYKEPAKMLHLICNESLVVDSTGLSIPLNVSISYEYNPPTDDAATAADGRWIYELYNPCDGSVHHYKMNDDEFSLFNTRCKSQMAHSTEPREANKIVHRQKVERDGSCFLYAVVVSLNEGIISAAIHRSKCHYKVDQCNDITSLDDDFEVIVSLRVGQVYGWQYTNNFKFN